MSRTAAVTSRSSRWLGRRPLATMQYVPALRAHASRAPSTSTSRDSIWYFATGAVETIDCEQYPQSSGQIPLFAFTSMFSFTLRPKCARLTRNAACNSRRSWSSSAARTVRASPRLSGSPASALSAKPSQRLATSSVTTSDMHNLPRTDRDAHEGVDVDVVFDQAGQPLARELALELRHTTEDRN